MTTYYGVLPLVLLASFAFITCGAWFASRLRDRLHLLLGLGAGAMVGAALFALLPEAAGGDLRPLAPLVGVGFVGYMLVERFLSSHFHQDADCESGHHDGRLAIVALIVHGLIDGLAVAACWASGVAVQVSVVAAILLHHFSDGMNIMSLVLRRGDDRLPPMNRAGGWLYLMWASVCIGILAGVSGLITVELHAVMAVLAGVFLYVGAADLLPESHHGHGKVWTTLATVAGMAAMYGITSIGA